MAGAGNAGDFLVVVPEGIRSSRYLESVFFAFVKFIMCLLVPEVKAVSRTCVLHIQVLESNKENMFFKAVRPGPQWVAGRVFSQASGALDSRRSRLLKYQHLEPIVHDMLKLWRTRMVNTKAP